MTAVSAADTNVVVAFPVAPEEHTDFNPDLPFMAVTHIMPDTDALACLWFVDRMLAKDNTMDTAFEFVRAGERIEGPSDAYNVIHVDTGGGKFDQHGKGLKRASSFQLLAAAFGYDDDPGVLPIMELTIATDNVEKVDPCSVHNVFKTLRGILKLPGSKEPNWKEILHYALVTFDALYSFHSKKAEGKEKFRSKHKLEELAGGIRFANLMFDPGAREGAYEAGADVVLWFTGAGKNVCYASIQTNEKSTARLGNLVSALRRAEATARGITLSDYDLVRFGNVAQVPWFIHDSNKLILAGSYSHPLYAGEHTKLTPTRIMGIVREALQKSGTAK